NYLANPTIADGAITSPKLADNAVTTRKSANGAVTNQQIADGTLTANKFVPGALTNETQNGLRITELEEEVDEHKAETVTDVANVVTGLGADPSGATDSSTAFANAAASKKRIEVPEGTYLVGDVELSGVYVFG